MAACTRQALGWALLLCLIGSSVARNAVNGELEAMELGCDDVSKLPPGQDRCAFVREKCEQQSYIVSYLQLYYCRIKPKGAMAATLMLATCFCVLALLFRVIARTADDFFSCILSQISQDMGLPPRLAGVTLLALGNGAPDLSACIAAVKTGNYRMALGALTGAGLFVGCVVAGRILTLNDGAKARWAQIRDVASYLIAAAVVLGIVASGSFTYGSVIVLLLLYCGYVVIVAVADFSKRYGVEWHEVARNLSRRLSLTRRVELATPLLQRRTSSPALPLDQLSDITEGPEELTAYRSQEDNHRGMELSSVSSQRFSELHLDQQELAELPAAGPAWADRIQAYLRQQAATTSLAPTLVRTAQSLPPHLPRPPSMAPHVPRAGPQLGRPPTAPARVGESPASENGEEAFQPGIEQQAGIPEHETPRLPSQHERVEGGHRRGFTLPLPGWLHPLQERHYPPTHARMGPTVAAFQPRVPYEDLVRMPAREYRQRALAEMAQSRSFHMPGRGRGGRGRESYESDAEPGDESLHGSDVELGHSGFSPSRVAGPAASPLGSSRPTTPQPPSQQQPPSVGSRPHAPQASQQQHHEEEEQHLPGQSSCEEEEEELLRGQPLHDFHRGLHPQDDAPVAPLAREGLSSSPQLLQTIAGAVGPHFRASVPGLQSFPPSSDAQQLLSSAVPALSPLQPLPPPQLSLLGDRAGYEPSASHDSPIGEPPIVPFAHPFQHPPKQQQQQQQLALQSVESAPPTGMPLPPAVERHHTYYTQYEFGSPGELAGVGEQADEREEKEALKQGPAAKVVATVEAPIMLALQATIPLVEMNSYQRHWFITSMACSPLFVCLYLQQLAWLPLLVALAAAAGLTAVAVAGTRQLGEQPPFWGWGTQFPIGAALVALYGFAVAAMWISLFAQEIVALLHFLGVVSGIDSGVLGLTVLAWGNSLMDYINNTSMAGKSAGGNSMAMTACYAGPLFNMLIGLGLGFWSLLAYTGASSVPVALSLDASLGFGAIIIVCGAIVTVALLNNHWLPQRFGWAMIGWYGFYMSVVLLVTVL